MSSSDISIGSNHPADLNSPTQDQSTSTTSAAAPSAVANFSRISSQPTSATSTLMPVSSVNASNCSSDGIAQSGAINVIVSPSLESPPLSEDSPFDPHPANIAVVIAPMSNILTILFFISFSFVLIIISN